MRRSILVVLSLLFSVFLSTAASADKPTPIDETFVDRTCGFRVLTHIKGKVATKTFENGKGRFVYKEIGTSPGLKATFTRVGTDETVRFSIAGPGFFREERDGSSTFIATGPWLLDFHPVTGEPGLWITRGRIVFSDEATTFTGRAVNVCNLLA